MDLAATSLLNPAVLFFALGLIAVALRSDLAIPEPVGKVLALYLLLAIGFRGGVELARTLLGPEVYTTLVASLAMALAVPCWVFAVLRRRIARGDAAALAAAYGSVSAVTFVTATSLAKSVDLPFGGHMVAALALMETPAILVGLLLLHGGRRSADAVRVSLLPHLRDALVHGTVLVLVGSLVIGMVTGARGEQALKPFTGDLFQGVLCFFLLDMGLSAGRRFGAVRTHGRWLVVLAIGVPLVNAIVALAIARILGMSPGNAFLFVVLAASASYIAVPATMRHAIPDADPGLYVTAPIALTFPFNVLVGMPLYLAAIRLVWP